MLKKILWILSITFILLSAWLVNAEINNSTTPTTWTDTLFQDNWLEFKAKLVDWVVYTSWKRFNNDNKTDSSDYFKWYKVVRSTNNSNPVYPNDGHIKYYDDITKLEYTDSYPKKWTSYYRVCAITHSEKRHCSNVVKVIVDSKEEMKMCTMDYTPVCWYKNWLYKTYSNKCTLWNDKAYYKYNWKCKDITNVEKKTYWLSTTLQIKSKWIINRFIKKIESKWFSNDKTVEVIDAIIGKLKSLEEKKPKLSNLLSYLIELLNEKKDNYQDDFSDIEDIFDID